MTKPTGAAEPVIIRAPRLQDGAAMWQVARDTGSLDLNASYSYLLLARDFADTCVVAESNGQIIGFATGYRRPRDPSVIFLWQIGIAPSAQGQGLGKKLISGFLTQSGADDAEWLETTISPDNTASKALFTGMAKRLQVDWQVSECFRADDFPEAGHEPEQLYRIGPLNRTARAHLQQHTQNKETRA